MRLALMLFAAALLVGCQEVEPDPGPERPESVEPFSTATPESPSTPDRPLAQEATGEDDGAVTILFFGDSLTAGYGLASPDLAYPALVGARLEEAGVPVRVVNAGVSGETSAGGRGRIDWALRQTTPDVFVLALGANDGLRGVDPEATRENLGAILDAVEEAAPGARLVVAGMEALPNYGEDYTERFRAVFPAVAEAHDAAFIPFLLDGVAGVDRLNQDDGVHPTPEGQRVIAETVAETVVPLARQAAS
jgi:acyl-CoA thioesterase-1